MDGQDSQDTGTYRALESVIARLLGPGGCPWDREQTHQSLKRYLLEECYELMEAIEDGDPKHMIEELGDVLVQVAFHIQLAQNEGIFGPGEVFASVNDKLVRRHPHVFGDGEASTAEQVKATWEDVKQKERGGSSSRLGSIPGDLPALAQAQLLQDRASLAGSTGTILKAPCRRLRRRLESSQRPRPRRTRSLRWGTSSSPWSTPAGGWAYGWKTPCGRPTVGSPGASPKWRPCAGREAWTLSTFPWKERKPFGKRPRR